jgi:hypothetical protein
VNIRCKTSPEVVARLHNGARYGPKITAPERMRRAHPSSGCASAIQECGCVKSDSAGRVPASVRDTRNFAVEHVSLELSPMASSASTWRREIADTAGQPSAT